jgi:hypothetical protein
MNFELEYIETIKMLNHHSDKIKKEGIDPLEDGMYNYLLGKQSVLREVLWQKLQASEMFELEEKAYIK